MNFVRNYHEERAAVRHFVSLKSILAFVSASQFHIYSPWVNAHLAWCLNSASVCLICESASRRFQPGEGPCRGLLRDCEILGNLRITLVPSSTTQILGTISTPAVVGLNSPSNCDGITANTPKHSNFQF